MTAVISPLLLSRCEKYDGNNICNRLQPTALCKSVTGVDANANRQGTAAAADFGTAAPLTRKWHVVFQRSSYQNSPAGNDQCHLIVTDLGSAERWVYDYY